MDEVIIRRCNHEVKARRKRRIAAGYLGLAEVVLGRRKPAWEIDSFEGDPPIRDDGRDEFFELAANAEVALAALLVGVAI